METPKESREKLMSELRQKWGTSVLVDLKNLELLAKNGDWYEQLIAYSLIGLGVMMNLELQRDEFVEAEVTKHQKDETFDPNGTRKGQKNCTDKHGFK